MTKQFDWILDPDLKAEIVGLAAKSLLSTNR